MFILYLNIQIKDSRQALGIKMQGKSQFCKTKFSEVVQQHSIKDRVTNISVPHVSIHVSATHQTSQHQTLKSLIRIVGPYARLL